MEEWKRWEPIKDVSGNYYIDFFGMSEERDFVIRLSDSDKVKKIEIRFNSAIGAYRYTNESFCFAVFGELSEKYGDDFYADWSFFKIDNSQYLQSISEKSRTWSDQFPFEHYSIFGNDEVIDVLAYFEPEVKFIE